MNMDVGEFKKWRKRMSWSQAEAAVQLGLTEMEVIMLDQGETTDGKPVEVNRLVELAMIALEEVEETRIPNKPSPSHKQQNVDARRPAPTKYPDGVARGANDLQDWSMNRRDKNSTWSNKPVDNNASKRGKKNKTR
jgi:hypothetical protein